LLIHELHSKGLLRVAATQHEAQQISVSSVKNTHTKRKLMQKREKKRKKNLRIRTKPPMLGPRAHCLRLAPSCDPPFCPSCHKAGRRRLAER